MAFKLKCKYLIHEMNFNQTPLLKLNKLVFKQILIFIPQESRNEVRSFYDMKGRTSCHEPQVSIRLLVGLHMMVLFLEWVITKGPNSEKAATDSSLLQPIESIAVLFESILLLPQASLH